MFAILDFGFSVGMRMLFAFAAALFLCLVFGSPVIEFLHQHQHGGQPIREDGPQSHLQNKKGTPTMGGLLILGAVIIAVLLFANVEYHFVWVSLMVLIMYGATGFVDDYWKVKKHTSNAMTARMKLFLQFLTALIAASIVTAATPQSINTVLHIPYFHDLQLNLSWLYIPFAVVVISGASNAVNLSDGLDGLASGLLIIAFMFFGIISYLSGMREAADFNMLFVPRCGEIAVVCAAIVGACLGFLYFNKPKAKIFMGDTGSLSLGAMLGTVAVMTKQEFLLAIVGLVFVAETLSVIIQVAYFKKTGKRFFRMAPIHHHFEQLGWSEKKVVLTFWAVALFMMLTGCLALF